MNNQNNEICLRPNSPLNNVQLLHDHVLAHSRKNGREVQSLAASAGAGVGAVLGAAIGGRIGAAIGGAVGGVLGYVLAEE